MPKLKCVRLHDLIELLVSWADDVQRLDNHSLQRCWHSALACPRCWN